MVSFSNGAQIKKKKNEFELHRIALLNMIDTRV